ncbi:sugar transferase, partial [Campylobacter insulaenigrae]|uniref:sugar transferase n=1 Tax=Campylobacter insulaenigrae TaxID=260714 RepID=UPI002152CB6C
STARNVGIEYFSGEYKLQSTNTENDLIEFDVENNHYNIYKAYKSSKAFNNEQDLTNFTYPIIDYIIFLDPDDYWELNCIEECVPRMEGVEIVWFDYKMFYDNIEKKYYSNKTNLTKSQMKIYEYYKPEKITSMQWLARCLKIQADLPFWCVWGAMFSFDYLLKIEFKFLDGLIHEDVHSGIFTFSQADLIYVFPKNLYNYRIRSASTATYDKLVTKDNIPPYIHNLYIAFDNNLKLAKEYHAKSSIFLNAYHIRKFISDILNEQKGLILEEAFFSFLYFWHFDFKDFKKDPRGITSLLKMHKPVYEENHSRYPEFDFFCKYGLVKYRINNHLAYILGKILITNSKINNFYKIPFKLIYAVIQFKISKRDENLPKLHEYPDYKNVYVIQGYLSYKLGKIIIDSFKKWYYGKPFLIPFLFYKTYKKFKLSKKNKKNLEIKNDTFIFPDNALINIAENKQTIQSSLSVYSKFNDASRALNYDLNINNYAFCTSANKHNWWLIDLEEAVYIECIRLFNTKNIFSRSKLCNVEIYTSIDNIHWTFIPREFCKWKYNDFECDIVLSNKISVRYVRLSLREEALSLSKVEIFKRNKKGYIVSAKPDGFGMRLASMLVGMYLAKKLDFNFGFTWPNSIDLAFMGITESKNDSDICYLGNAMDEVDKVFDEVFISKFLLDKDALASNHGNIIRKKERNLDFLSDISNFEEDWGWYSTDILPSKWLKDCNEEECLSEISDLYKNISFSDEYKNIICDVEDKFSNLQNNFVALHIRGGDIIYSKIRKSPNFTPVVERFFPYEIALEIAIMELKNNKNIIVFGQDLNANKELVMHLQSLREYKHLSIIDISSLIKVEYNEMQRAFFEINFMSKAQKIYSAKESVFSKIAMMISGKNILLSFHNVFNQQEQLKLIVQNMYILNLHPLQVSMSYFRLFQLSQELGQSVEKNMQYLYEALKIDDDNDGYRIYILKCLFAQKKYKDINLELKSILSQRYHRFYETLLPYSLGGFDECYKDYIEFDNIHYPYIVFLAMNICEFLGDLNRYYYLKSLIEKSIHRDEILSISNSFSIHKEYNAVKYIKSSLYYKLGNSLISMNILMIFKMLSNEKKQNKLIGGIENRLQLENLCVCDEAKEVMNHLSYRFGVLLFNTHKSWYKGAYLLLPYRLYKEYRNFKQGKKKWQ